MRIVVDGMGGDNAPKSNVEGVVNAIKEYGITDYHRLSYTPVAKYKDKKNLLNYS